MTEFAPLSLRGPLLALAVAGSCAVGCRQPDTEPAASSAEPDRAAILAEVDLRLEAPEADGAAMRWVRDVAGLSDGRLVVALGRPPTVRLYAADGRFLQNVGRQGRGADRFWTTTAVEALDGDLIAVRSGRQVLVYRADGEHTESFQVQNAAPATGSRSDLVAGGEGSFVLPGRSPSQPTGMLGGGSVDHLIRTFVDDARQTTIPVPAARRSSPRLRTPRAEGWLEPFIVETLHAWSPLGHLVVGRNDRYSIRARGGGSAEATPMERDIPRAPITPGERALWANLLARVRSPGAETPVSADAADLPELKPYFRELFVDDKGRVWVWRYVEAELRDPSPVPRGQRIPIDWREPTTFDVFAPDGRLLDTVVVPPLTRITQVRGDTLWGVQEDAAGNPHAVRLRLQRSLDDPRRSVNTP